RWFVTGAVPLRDEHGGVVSWFGSTTDIHQQKEMEQALRHADRRKDEFLATLSHELRNPLAPMGYALDLLHEAGNDAPTIERARTMMERQLIHLVRLVDDLLDISRVTAGKLQLERGAVALSTIVDSAVESSQPQIEAGGQHLEVELPLEPLVVDGDTTRLSQVLTNLLNNAARYTPRGGSIRLAAERRGDEVALWVRDTGIGLAPGQAERIFDLFVQGREAAQSQRGLGVGLALARALVELHGGRIAASSDGPGLGAEILVHLPLLATGSVIEAAARAAAPLASPP
ncbi:MAG TPA: HAMP domain-containing sensor histidine kinase, partial [Thermoanaerobaculia bacterium]|nr:HAMP domain-containing sensor histidine kinase [Thermoanaerobaculia bacterium]